MQLFPHKPLFFLSVDFKETKHAASGVTVETRKCKLLCDEESRLVNLL